MDVSQYLEIFIDETKEHIQSLNDQILILEKEPDNADTINEIFRAAHSLKGMAGTMGYKRMQRLTHDLENVFSEVRAGKMKVTPPLVDVLFKGIDAIQAYLDTIVNSGDEGTEDNEDIITQLNAILAQGGAASAEPAKKEEAPAPEQAPQAAQAATQTAAQPAGDKAKYKAFKYAEHEVNAIKKALEEKDNVFGITVYVQETCLLKAARAFLVFKKLEEMGTIIKSEPSVQDIEDERFDLDFSLTVITKENIDKVKEGILSISEIEDAVLSSLTLDDLPKETASEEGDTSAASKDVPAAAKAAAQTKPAAQSSGKPVVNRSVRVDIEKLDDLMNLVSELIIAKNGLVSINNADDTNKTSNSSFNEQIEYLERITTNLHTSVMKVRMVPLESVVNRFPRLVRDLNKKLNKKMELYISGEETELDRTVIDEIGDPLMHLLRNAADHGLESNEERIKIGKPEVGSIFLNAFQEGNNVVIEVRDDGRGIDIEKVRNKAIQKINNFFVSHCLSLFRSYSALLNSFVSYLLYVYTTT
ncbi:MAG: chemotaxis protein CheA, partial [Lachnospiraceae bacterium]|nr:chemotaxis protein CheA [Lachnospiraceae bacterium]